MRIIGGQYKRRRLQSPPPNTITRPIPDRVKEAIFNMLRGHFEGIAVLDLFAGTGAIGLEAVSRGASDCVFVEKDRKVVRTLQANIDDLGCADRCRVITGDALAPTLTDRVAGILDGPVHLVFVDPPYAMIDSPFGWERVREQTSRVITQLLDETGYAAVRTPWPFTLANDDGPRTTPDLSIPGALGPETHAYNSTAYHLYMKAKPSDEHDAV